MLAIGFGKMTYSISINLSLLVLLSLFIINVRGLEVFVLVKSQHDYLNLISMVFFASIFYFGIFVFFVSFALKALLHFNLSGNIKNRIRSLYPWL